MGKKAEWELQSLEFTCAKCGLFTTTEADAGADAQNPSAYIRRLASELSGIPGEFTWLVRLPDGRFADSWGSGSVVQTNYTPEMRHCAHVWEIERVEIHVQRRRTKVRYVP